MKNPTIKEIYDNSALLEVARKAIEDALIDFRDARISEFRNNGCVCKEKDGSPSSVIRFGTETAMRIGLKAIEKHLAQAEND